MGPCASREVLVSFLNLPCVSPCSPFPAFVQEHVRPVSVHTQLLECYPFDFSFCSNSVFSSPIREVLRLDLCSLSLVSVMLSSCPCICRTLFTLAFTALTLHLYIVTLVLQFLVSPKSFLTSVISHSVVCLFTWASSIIQAICCFVHKGLLAK